MLRRRQYFLLVLGVGLCGLVCFAANLYLLPLGGHRHAAYQRSDDLLAPRLRLIWPYNGNTSEIGQEDLEITTDDVLMDLPDTKDSQQQELDDARDTQPDLDDTNDSHPDPGIEGYKDDHSSDAGLDDGKDNRLDLNDTNDKQSDPGLEGTKDNTPDPEDINDKQPDAGLHDETEDKHPDPDLGDPKDNPSDHADSNDNGPDLEDTNDNHVDLDDDHDDSQPVLHLYNDTRTGQATEELDESANDIDTSLTSPARHWLVEPEASPVDATDTSTPFGENFTLSSECGPCRGGGEDADPAVRARRDAVRAMMQHAWAGYAKAAWGHNELRPVSAAPFDQGVFGDAALGVTLVDGLDTLLVMGLTEEFQQGRDWVERHLHPADVDADVSVLETNIRLVGGLLSCFALTGDAMFRDKARQIADRLLPAFDTPTGLPRPLVNLKTGMSQDYSWSGGYSILSEVGTLHLEFQYLSDVTGDAGYADRVRKIRTLLGAMEKPLGLYHNFVSPTTAAWGQQRVSMGSFGDSFYEYLLKSWLQSGWEDAEARAMFDQALDGIFAHMYRTSAGGLAYFADLQWGLAEPRMEHLACFAGGMLALAAQGDRDDDGRADRYRESAAAITHTCHESYERSAAKLGPEVLRFESASAEAATDRQGEKHYSLRPEAVESYFVLWRTTGDARYREWGWQAAEALERLCRVPGGGYSGLTNVYAEDPPKDDLQQSYFLAETLKYLYLLFSSDEYFPLDEWVFNTEAHPLPIRGSAYYRGHLETEGVQ